MTNCDQAWNTIAKSERELCLLELATIERSAQGKREDAEAQAMLEETEREEAENEARTRTRREHTPEWEAVKYLVNVPGTYVNDIANILDKARRVTAEEN